MRLMFGPVVAAMVSGPALAAAPCALGPGLRPAEAADREAADREAPAQCLPDQTRSTALAGGRFGTCRTEAGDIIDYLTLQGVTTIRPVPAAYAGNPEDVLAFAGDVDGDGAADVITARLDTVSNGLGVGFWTVAIAGSGADFARSTRFTVEDFGPGIFAARLDGKPGCRVLASHWALDQETARFEGHWYEIVPGGLSLAPAGPALHRRLTRRFEADRLKTMESLAARTGLFGLGAPLDWLGDKGAAPLAPGMAPPAATAESLTIVGIEDRPTPDDDDWPRPTLVARAAMGAAMGSERLFLLQDIRIGSRAAARLWPADYRPADPAAWAGRRALFDDERSDSDRPILWLE